MLGATTSVLRVVVLFPPSLPLRKELLSSVVVVVGESRLGLPPVVVFTAREAAMSLLMLMAYSDGWLCDSSAALVDAILCRTLMLRWVEWLISTEQVECGDECGVMGNNRQSRAANQRNPIIIHN